MRKKDKISIEILIWITLFFTIVMTVIYVKNSRRNSSLDYISVPSASYPVLFIINADSATLIKSDKLNYHLILNNSDKLVNYVISSNHSSSGSCHISQFISLWASKPYLKIEADMTGVQVDNKTFGHTQFYAHGILANPIYDGVSHKLTFDVAAIKSTVDIKEVNEFKTVELFINGCDFNKSSKNPIKCKDFRP